MIAFLDDLYRRGPFDRHLAADVTFTALGMGQVIEGRTAVERFIRHFHEVAFDARPRVTSIVVHDERVVFTADFVGIHTGEFMGQPATGREVDVPCNIIVDFQDDQIIALRGLLPIGQLLQQIGVESPDDSA